ncbi:MAG: mycofactocin biosynthesis glycosyltransferase MftF [Gaiellaceae bacterium]
MSAETPSTSADLPRVSVIAPVRNRVDSLRACLQSLERLRYPAELLEIVVVDDGSTDATPGVVAESQGCVELSLVRLPSRRGPAAARNAGAGEARGEILAFVDSDCLVDPDWLAELVPEFRDAGVAAAGGAVLQIDHGGRLDRYDAVRSPAYLGGERALVRPGTRVSYLSGASMLVRRADFTAAGGFDTTLRVGEDLDLVWRLAAAGRRVVYNPRGRVQLDHRDTPVDFVRRRMTYAASEVPLLRRHGHPRRVLELPVLPALALAGAAVAVAVGRAELAPLALGPLLLDLAFGRDDGESSTARLRAHGRDAGSFLYHGARALSRYYAAPVAAGTLALELAVAEAVWAWPVLAAALAGPTLADWVRLRPPLNPLSFAAIGVLDNLSYHGGIVAACARQRTLRPLALHVSARVRRRGLRLGPVPTRVE